METETFSYDKFMETGPRRCVVCDRELEPAEGRIDFPGHIAQLHIECGMAPRTFYRPVHSDAGSEAAYWRQEEATEAIKVYADDEEFADGEWEIREVTMTPVEFLRLPEFDGF